jgi:hypothetical protein
MRAAILVLTIGGVAMGCTAINTFDDVVIRQDPPPPECAAEPCKLTSPQCGCPAGQMCEYVSGSVECVTEAPAKLGEECMPYGCAAGLHCLQFFGAPSTCHAWCDGDGDCVDGGRCVITLSDGFPQRLCSTRCDPITSENCSLPGSKCALLLSLESQEWYTSCGAEGAGMEGATCADTGDCAVGHHCVSIDLTETCRPYCLVQNPQCPTGQTCVNFDPSSVVDGVIYGVCVLPPATPP